MEYKWKSLKQYNIVTKKNNDTKELIEIENIVNKVLSIKIQDKLRTRYMVDGRIIFSALARQRGYTFKQISTYLDKNHATIIHLLKNFGYLLDSIPSFKEKYDEIKDCFLNGKEPSVLVDEVVETKKSISELKNQIERLILQKQQLMLIHNKNKRITNIIELIETKTPIGLEDFVQKKIMQMFNNQKFFEL